MLLILLNLDLGVILLLLYDCFTKQTKHSLQVPCKKANLQCANIKFSMKLNITNYVKTFELF